MSTQLKYIVDDQNHPVEVVIPIELYERIKPLVENIGLNEKPVLHGTTLESFKELFSTTGKIKNMNLDKEILGDREDRI